MVDKFHIFSPPRPVDYSTRVISTKQMLPPITETVFDQFALDVKEGKITLDRIVEDEWICRLGCPLCVFLAHAFTLVEDSCWTRFASRYLTPN